MYEVGVVRIEDVADPVPKESTDAEADGRDYDANEKSGKW
jgi:hypothetical protein